MRPLTITPAMLLLAMTMNDWRGRRHPARGSLARRLSTVDDGRRVVIDVVPAAPRDDA